MFGAWALTVDARHALHQRRGVVLRTEHRCVEVPRGSGVRVDNRLQARQFGVAGQVVFISARAGRGRGSPPAEAFGAGAAVGGAAGSAA